VQKIKEIGHSEDNIEWSFDENSKIRMTAELKPLPTYWT